MIPIIEVKNWSGQLSVRDGVWRQTRRGGDVVEHGDLIRENLLKRDAMVACLHDQGLDLDGLSVDEHIVPSVVFTNPRLELDPATEARPDVISRREPYRKPDLVQMTGNQPIRLEWSRGRIVGLLKAITGIGSLGSLDLRRDRLEVTPDDTVKFHAVSASGW